MTKKLIIIISVVVIVILIILWQTVFKKEELPFDLAEAVRGDIHQEVLETGMVTKGEQIDLVFKNSGTIEKIYVSVGDVVEKGEILARLDRDQLEIQLNQAQASLASAQASLNKLLAGFTPEEIKISETDVRNSQISLATAQENLDNSYEDALNVLDLAYLNIYNSLDIIETLQGKYFSSYDEESQKIKEEKEKIETNFSQAENYIEKAKADPKKENIDQALFETKKALNNIANSLTVIRDVCQASVYRGIASTEIASLDTQRTAINTNLTNVINSQQTISVMRLNVETAEGVLQKAEDTLAFKKAGPRQEDIDIYQASVKQAQAQVQLLESQIQDASLRSPTNGQIAEINKKEGETAVAYNTLISLLPLAPFEIEVDIYEEDVVKINTGNSVDISLVAFPDQSFKGEIILINPVEKLVEGVVYYEVKIDFKETPENIKPGMTADLTIHTLSKENVLIIPFDAVFEKDDKEIVEVFKDGSIEEREVVTGLEGSDDMVEVISGLTEGENVILR